MLLKNLVTWLVEQISSLSLPELVLVMPALLVCLYYDIVLLCKFIDYIGRKLHNKK